MPQLDAIEVQLVEYLQSQREAIISLCQRLLQTPSVNGEHDEAGLVAVMEEAAQSMGLITQISALQAHRPNLIASTAEEGSTGLLLIGHTDTVPTGDPSAWTYPPFSGELANGRIYGRGAVDTKGGMTASLWALAALKAVPGALHAGRAQFIGVPDEETGATGTLGVRHLDAEGLLSGLGAIYAYSGRTIHIGHRGLLRYRIRCFGEATHAGGEEWQAGTRGASAVLAMADLLLRMEALSFPNSQQPYFDAYNTRMNPGTVIKGGTNINIVPDYCEALMDVRTTPENGLAEVEPMIEALISEVSAARPRIRFELERLNHASAAISAPDSAVFVALQSATEDLTGHQPPLAVAGPTNEGYLLVEAGIPTVCGFGPIGDQFHAIDEYVEADSLVEAAALYAITARRLSEKLGA